jgi:hypothetical protein
MSRKVFTADFTTSASLLRHRKKRTVNKSLPARGSAPRAAASWTSRGAPGLTIRAIPAETFKRTVFDSTCAINQYSSVNVFIVFIADFQDDVNTVFDLQPGIYCLTASKIKET